MRERSTPPPVVASVPASLGGGKTVIACSGVAIANRLHFFSLPPKKMN
jgi:hypothetical protein